MFDLKCSSLPLSIQLFILTVICFKYVYIFPSKITTCHTTGMSCSSASWEFITGILLFLVNRKRSKGEILKAENKRKRNSCKLTQLPDCAVISASYSSLSVFPTSPKVLWTFTKSDLMGVFNCQIPSYRDVVSGNKPSLRMRMSSGRHSQNITISPKLSCVIVNTSNHGQAAGKENPSN